MRRVISRYSGDMEFDQRDINSEQQGSPKTDCRGRKPIRKTPEFLSQEESEGIIEFMLNQIRSRHPDRYGRVAKRRVRISSPSLWERCKIALGGEREAFRYKNNFTHLARKLHLYPQLCLADKADLYYALDLRVDESIRPELSEKLGIQFNELGIITGSSAIQHWDIVHPDSEIEEEDSDFKYRFSELEDGKMWQFIVNDVNSGNVREVYTRKVWEEFREIHGTERAAETYRGRFSKILLPNLHLMPFNIETKATLYFRLGHPVPHLIRKRLANATNVKYDQEGIIIFYPHCPKEISLNTVTPNSVIGISSPHRVSTLKAPLIWSAQPPYTEEEDRIIWEYILSSGCSKRDRKIGLKMNGWVFWKQFIRVTRSRRTWQSLSEHFMADLRPNIMNLDCDLKIKMKLYYTLSIPVDKETLRQFQTIANVFLNSGNVIRFAAGQDFLVGRSDGSIEEDHGHYTAKLNAKNIGKFVRDFTETYNASLEEEESKKKAEENLPNSEKYPYIPVLYRPMRILEKRKRQVMAQEARREARFPKKYELRVLEEQDLLEEEIKLEPQDNVIPQNPVPSDLLIEKKPKLEDGPPDLSDSFFPPPGNFHDISQCILKNRGEPDSREALDLSKSRMPAGSYQIPNPLTIPPHKRPLPKEQKPLEPENPGDKKLDAALSGIEYSLKFFTRQLEDLSPLLTDKQRDDCMDELAVWEGTVIQYEGLCLDRDTSAEEGIQRSVDATLDTV
uniref:SPK domain-containing protein n=1 Tax=Caenorhabditis tropicalis TaxID=1561998 RepID=A0A1I7T2K7_9PELO